MDQDLQGARSLRGLYFTRTVVQLIWAGTVIGVAATNPTAAAALLVLYPLWDVACTLYDVKRSAGSGSAPVQYANVAAGLLTAIGIGATAFKQPSYAVAIFGVWALVAGLLQLAVGVVRRRKLGGQWAMILSGLQSAGAGVAFILGGLGGKLHIKDLGGYAVFGGVYFLIAGVLLSRKIASMRQAESI